MIDATERWMALSRSIPGELGSGQGERVGIKGSERSREPSPRRSHPLLHAMQHILHETVTVLVAHDDRLVSIQPIIFLPLLCLHPGWRVNKVNVGSSRRASSIMAGYGGVALGRSCLPQASTLSAVGLGM